MKCKYCGFEMPTGAQYCEECGAAVEESINLNKNDQQPTMQDLGAPQNNSQHDYSGQQNYANQQNYASQQNYAGQQNYASQQNYSGQQNYANQQNYGYQPGTNNNQQQYSTGQQGYGTQQYGYQQQNNNFTRQNEVGQAFGGFAGGFDPNATTLNMTADSPRYVSMTDAVKLFFKNLTNYQGRSTRSEYWYAILAMWIAMIASIIVISIVMSISDILGGLLLLVWGIACLALSIPSTCLMIRRLHDVGRSGWFMFISFIPIGGFILLLHLLMPSEGANQYGPAPNPDPRAFEPNHINML